jgi:hypothetical protein
LQDRTALYISDRTTGWWNCLLAADFDNDGDQDFVVGNFGLNNQFKPTPDRPITLYYADYDANGSIDPIMNYFIGNKSYPAPTRDELVDQVPAFKKLFTDYASYTDATIEKILTSSERAKSKTHTAYRLESIYLQNNGSSFSIRTLPLQLQFSPVFALQAVDVDADENLDVVAGGNISKMGARFGKADASVGTVLRGDGKGGFEFLPVARSGWCVRGDVRKILVQKNNRIIVAVNDQTPIVFEIQRE